MIDFTLMKHQQEIIYRAQFEPDLYLNWEVGTGKSCATVQILRHKYADNDRLMKTLIITPLITLKNWKHEFDMFSKIPQKAIHILKGSKAKRAKHVRDLKDYPAIVITNYESFDSEELVTALINWGVEIIVCDEAHLLKNPQSKRAKRIARVSDVCKNHYLLSGTPILNNSMDIFMQFRVLDGYLKRKSTFGTNFFVFRGNYFEDANAAWAGKKNHFPQWVPRPSTYKKFSELINKKMSHIEKKDVLDLPPLVKENRYCMMSKEQERLYKEMRRDLITYIENELKDGAKEAVVARMAITKALRLQQITTGFCKSDTDSIIAIDKNPRLELLKDLLIELTPKHKVIVWAVFKENYKQIKMVCNELGIKFVELTGEITNKEKFENMESFNKDAETRVCIANPQSASMGINLIESDYSIYYSRSYKLGDSVQSEGRNYRKGSEKHEKITHINLVCQGTIDETIHETLENKQKLADLILNKDNY